MIYPFPNFNGATVDVWEWISYFIPHFTGHVITYPCWDYKLIHVSKRGSRTSTEIRSCMDYYIPYFRVEFYLSTMMTSPNGNIFRVTGPLCGEFTGDRWIPRTKASDAELWCFLWPSPEPTIEQWKRRWFETPSRSLWCHYNYYTRNPMTV